MSDHYHIVIPIDVDQVNEWSDEEVPRQQQNIDFAIIRATET
jgi:hypothetical protein